MYAWNLFDVTVGLDQIKTETSILSFAAQWVGENKPMIWRGTGGRGRARVRDDKALVAELRELFDEADVVLGQNVKRFDVPRANARMAVHGFEPYSPVRVIDTLEMAKKTFAFSSNRLAWLSKHLTPAEEKDEHKNFPGFSLWRQCLEDDPKAFRELEKYNCQDVTSTIAVWEKLKGWAGGAVNLGLYSDDESGSCPRCGSFELQSRGFAVTNTGRFRRFQCTDCGGWSTSKVNLLSKTKRAGALKAS